MYSNLGSPWQPLAMGVPQEPAPAQGILMIAPVCPIPVAPPMMGFPPIEPLRGIETRPVESLEFYSSPNTQRQSWRNRPPSRGGRGSGGFGGGAHGDYEQTGWDHRHWLEQYSAGIATGQDGFVKQLRQQVADHNFGMFQRDVGNLGRVPETIYASYSDTFRKRVAGTGRDPKISFSGATTTEAIMYFAQQHGREVCALNFANGEHVGGGYVRGAKAQEEDICRTFPLLYTSLIRAKKKRLYPYGPPAGPHRYSDVLFTGRVLCCRGEESEGYRMLHERERFTASFVSGAAPNIRKGEQFDREKFVNAIKNIVVAPRIHAPELNVLLLGAWGCGAFGGDPEVVAQCYIEVLKMPIARLWHEIHFPIPGSGLNENARVFSKTLARAFPGMDTYSNLGSL
eukprot:GEMP01018417.1.p1 GENE.GEMP01018417.1~~GEMP01018417.1.p1  ORF type:complete len:398 (+),score=59.47 GEMP01018417.1:180-1373(+)